MRDLEDWDYVNSIREQNRNKYCFISSKYNFLSSCKANMFYNNEAVEKLFLDKSSTLCYIDLKIGIRTNIENLKTFLKILIWRMNNGVLVLHISNEPGPNFRQKSLYDLEVFYEIYEHICNEVNDILNISFELKEHVGNDVLNDPAYKQFIEYIDSKSEKYINPGFVETSWYTEDAVKTKIDKYQIKSREKREQNDSI